MARYCFSVLLLFAAGNAVVEANGWRNQRAVAYYYPAPVVYVAPVVAPCPIASGQATPQIQTGQPPLAVPYASPTPAPPSAPTGSSPPPATRPAPVIEEPRSFFNSYPSDHMGTAGVDNASVSFWNLSDRDMTVKVNGREHTLAVGKSLPLTLARQFLWTVDSRPMQMEQVPAGSGGVDIVIRR